MSEGILLPFSSWPAPGLRALPRRFPRGRRHPEAPPHPLVARRGLRPLRRRGQDPLRRPPRQGLHRPDPHRTLWQGPPVHGPAVDAGPARHNGEEQRVPRAGPRQRLHARAPRVPARRQDEAGRAQHRGEGHLQHRPEDVELDDGWFTGKKELRALQLGQWREFAPLQQIVNPMDSHIEVSGVDRLADMGSCRSLRYTSFRGISRIESLPDSIGKLRELVVLDLRACHNLEDLGQGITMLDWLEYLDLSECHLLGGMPRGLGRLTRLEVLRPITTFGGSDKVHQAH